MSFEERMHKKIEEGNAEEKRAALNAVFSREEMPEEGGGTELVIRRRWLLASAVFGAFLLFLLIFSLVYFGRNMKRDRYCSYSEYTVSETEQTLKEYSAERGSEILYFDWYSETSSRNSKIAVLNSTQEIICFREDICDESSGKEISLSVTDNHTTIDSLKGYDAMCINSEGGTVIVKWGGKFDSYAMFEYKRHRYFIMIKDAESPKIALNYAIMLLKSKETGNFQKIGRFL